MVAKPEDSQHPSMREDNFDVSRGDLLRRRDYHEELRPRSGDPSLERKGLSQLLNTLRDRQRGWALSIALIGPDQNSTGTFLQQLFDAGLERRDKITLVRTSEQRIDAKSIDERLVRLMFDPQSRLVTRPRVKAWFYSAERRELSRESFDLVYVPAATSDDLDVAASLRKYASLIIADRDGNEFENFARSVSDPNLPAFSFSAASTHCTPLMTEGTDESVHEYMRYVAMACDSPGEAKCAERECPAHFVLKLIQRLDADS